MIKFLSYEFNKDDRDYRRFFQSRNVSLSSFAKLRSYKNEIKASGKKNTISENAFFPLIAKKMIKL